MASTALLRRFPSPGLTSIQGFHPLRPCTAMRPKPHLREAVLSNLITCATRSPRLWCKTEQGEDASREVGSSGLAFAVAMATLLAPHEALAATGVVMESGKEILRLSAAEIDPGTAKLAISVLGPLFAAFNLMFVVRIVMSWYPQLPVGKFPFSIAYAPTEPVLGPTRRLIPPVGGVDVAPVIWVALMSFLNEILLGNQGLLVLLSQQQP